MPTIQINNETLTYNKIIYVDAINGDDTSGDGSKDNPYATIQKAVSVLDTDKTAIKLTGGQTYNEHASQVVGSYGNRENALFNLTANVDYDVIGDPENPPTVKLVSFGSGSYNYFLTLSGNNITKAHTINFYDLILVPEVPGGTCLSDLSASYTHTVTFNNVVFDHNAQGWNFAYLNGGQFGTVNGITYNINNSIINATRFAYINTGNCYVNLANSLILCEKPISYNIIKGLTLTLDTCWVYPDTSENYWTGTWEVKDPQLDSQYNITVDGWQDVGTGTDPDGSVADIGVYGGPYAWGDWGEPANYVTGSADISGTAIMSVEAQKIKGATFSSIIGQGTVSVDAQKIKGARFAPVTGQATVTANAMIIANASTDITGKAKMEVKALRLIIPSGVYQITPDDYRSKNQPAKSDEIANYIIVETQPLKPVDTPEEVYRSNESVSIAAGETMTITVHYNDTPVIEATASLEGQGANTTITNINYYAWGADVKITNSGTADDTFILVITGKPLKVQGKERAIAYDEASIIEHGKIVYEFSKNHLVQTKAMAQKIADKLLASFKDSKRDLSLDWRGNPALILGDIVNIPEYQRGHIDQRGNFYITRQILDYDGSLTAILEGRKME